MVGQRRANTRSQVQDVEGGEEEEIDEEDEADEEKENEGAGSAATGNRDNGTKTLTYDPTSDDLSSNSDDDEDDIAIRRLQASTRVAIRK
jgi:hypothetical protein